MIPLRKSHRALTTGETEWIRNSDSQVLSYIRKALGDDVLVVVNLSNSPVEIALESQIEQWREIAVGGGSEKRPLQFPKVALDAFQFRIFERTK